MVCDIPYLFGIFVLQQQSNTSCRREHVKASWGCWPLLFDNPVSWGSSCTETDDFDYSPNGFCVHKNTTEAKYMGVKTDPQYM